MAKKEMDQLSRDSVAAREAGVSYGKYMAQKEAVKVQVTGAGICINPDQTTGQQKRLFCIHCGKLIPDHTRQRLYCGEECRKLFTAEQSHKKYIERTASRGPMVHACPVCGAEFTTTDRRKAFCSPTCSKVARSERVRKYRENKRAKENTENGI